MSILFWATDCQRDFCNKDGKLYVEGAETIKPRLKEITEYAREHKITVVNTADCHNDKSKEITGKPDYKTIFPPHCMITSEGIDFIEEVDPKTFKDNYSMVCYTDKGLHHSFDRARNIIIYKDEFDVFSNPLTEEVLKRLNPKLTVVYGVATNVCVDFAVMGLLKRDYHVVVISDAIKELPNFPIDPIIDRWRHAGSDMMTWSLIKDYINIFKE